MQKATKYFYDSYAVMAYLSDNQNYKSYFEENDGFLTKLNLLEIYYRTLEVHGSTAASQVITVFSKYVVDFQQSDIEGSMALRLKLKKNGRNISYADALGYFFSLKANVKFLTGDKWFKGLENVEFVI